MNYDFSFTKTVTAKKLKLNDHFDLAGEFYRISNVRKNAFDQRVIRCHPIDKPFDHTSTLIVDKNSLFNVYN